MGKNIVSANFISSKPSYTSSNLTAANNIVNVNLNDTDIKINGQNAVNVDILSNVELTEPEYSLEELLEDAENQRQEAEALLAMVENQKADKNKKVAEHFQNKIKDLNLYKKKDFDMINEFYNALSPEEKAYVDPKLISDMQKALDYYIKNSCENLTDEQNLQLIRVCTYITYNDFFNGNNPKNYYGKTLKEISEILEENNTNKKLKYLIDNNMGEYTLVEVNGGNLAFDAVVLQDTLGNYVICYAGTKDSEDFYEDIKSLIASAHIAVSNSNLTDATSMVEKLNNQISPAKKLAKKYYEKARSEGKKVNLGGHSLGAHLAEQAFLGLYSDTYFDETFGSLNLFNGFHVGLGEEGANTIVNYDGSRIYATQGDIVSAIANYDIFSANTKYLYYDWETKINESGFDGLLDAHSIASLYSDQFDENGMVTGTYTSADFLTIIGEYGSYVWDEFSDYVSDVFNG